MLLKTKLRTLQLQGWLWDNGAVICGLSAGTHSNPVKVTNHWDQGVLLGLLCDVPGMEIPFVKKTEQSLGLLPCLHLLKMACPDKVPVQGGPWLLHGTPQQQPLLLEFAESEAES